MGFFNIALTSEKWTTKVKKLRTEEWPSGCAYLIAEELEEKFRPKDMFSKANNNQPDSNVKSSSEDIVKSEQQSRRNSHSDKAKMEQSRVSSDAGATTAEQDPCRSSAPVPNRESQANTQPKKLAKQSSGNSLNRIKQRKGPKRKAGTQVVFGTASSKRAGVEFTEGNAMQYPGKGRSSRALALTSDIHGNPLGHINPNAA